MEKVWILFSLANEYYQPERAFEKLWWSAPTFNDLKGFGFTETEAKEFVHHGKAIKYWVECFTNK